MLPRAGPLLLRPNFGPIGGLGVVDKDGRAGVELDLTGRDHHLAGRQAGCDGDAILALLAGGDEAALDDTLGLRTLAWFRLGRRALPGRRLLHDVDAVAVEGDRHRGAGHGDDVG